MSHSTAEPATPSATGCTSDSPTAGHTTATRIRKLLNRRGLAATRHRLAVRRRLRLLAAEMLTLAQLARDGEQTATQLRHALGYSAGASTAS